MDFNRFLEQKKSKLMNQKWYLTSKICLRTKILKNFSKKRNMNQCKMKNLLKKKIKKTKSLSKTSFLPKQIHIKGWYRKLSYRFQSQSIKNVETFDLKRLKVSCKIYSNDKININSLIGYLKKSSSPSKKIKSMKY